MMETSDARKRREEACTCTCTRNEHDTIIAPNPACPALNAAMDRVTGQPATAYTPPEDVVCFADYEADALADALAASGLHWGIGLRSTARFLLAAGYVSPTTLAARVRQAQAEALREAADYRAMKVVAEDPRVLNVEAADPVVAWLRDRADRLAAGEES